MRHESTMCVPWARVAAENRTALPELQKVARKFAPADRKQIIMLLFKTKKLFETVAKETDTVVAVLSAQFVSRPWCIGQ